MRNTRWSWLAVGFMVVGLLGVATVADARQAAQRGAGHRAHAHDASGAALAPTTAAQFEGSCGYGHYFLGEEMSFSHSIPFSVTVDANHGYLIDCVQGADAYLEFRGSSDGLYTYAIWGQLGSYG